MIARIQRLALPKNRRILAISDIHGNLPYFKGLLEKVGFCRDDILFLVGDFLEKGPHSLDTLRFVMELCRNYTVHVSCGNCDWWYPILNSPDPRVRGSSVWYINAKPQSLGRQMCQKLGVPVTPDMDPEFLRRVLLEGFPAEFDFLCALPEIIETEHYTFVHGGLPQGPPTSWDAWGCLKFDNFLNRSPGFDKWVICGHWPVMLYHENIVDANPVIDREKKIASIDGGCVLKDDGQLNALIIPFDGSEDFTWVAYDPFPAARVRTPQAASEKSWYIRWGDNKVQVLEEGQEFCRCRHLRTGYEMDILTRYLSGDGQERTANDCTDYALPLRPGDIVSIVEETSRGWFVKHRGVSGWYFGELERLI
ncbi:MAG: metallophosphoesterase [Oscillospiraceae bacterium]